jgi:hypothetical protein
MPYVLNMFIEVAFLVERVHLSNLARQHPGTGAQLTEPDRVFEPHRRCPHPFLPLMKRLNFRIFFLPSAVAAFVIWEGPPRRQSSFG